MQKTLEHTRAMSNEFIMALQCLPPIDMILSEYKLAYKVRPILVGLRDTALLYSNSLYGHDNFELQADEVNQQKILISAFQSNADEQGRKRWSLTINSANQFEKGDHSLDFHIEVRDGRPTKFSVENVTYIEDGKYLDSTRTNRLETMTLLEDHLSRVHDRIGDYFASISDRY